MDSNYKTLEYKGKTIFSKVVMDDFKRILKYFREEEACFMFIDNGSFLLRTPEETIRLICLKENSNLRIFKKSAAFLQVIGKHMEA